MARFLEQHDVGRMPEASSEYWATLHRLVALGRIDEALRLLGLHSAWQRAFSQDDKSIAVQVGGCRFLTRLPLSYEDLCKNVRASRESVVIEIRYLL